MNEWKPTTVSELCRMLEQNFQGPRTPVFPVGGRTGLVGPVQGIAINTAALDRVIDYPARDMTITVEAGIRMERLQEVMAAEGQRLPIDIPQAHRATLGGAIACNASGPARFGYGTFRDYLIGMTAVDAEGRQFSAGGRVVKNVAGYDLCKLMIGSEGSLATLTQVTLKTRPVAAARSLVWLPVHHAHSVEQLLNALLVSATRPVLMDVVNQKALRQMQGEFKHSLPLAEWGLCLGFEGATADVQWQTQTAKSELQTFTSEEAVELTGSEADRLWSVLTEYQAASDDPLSFRASLLPSQVMPFLELATELQIAVQAHAGNGILIGHLPDSCTDPQAANAILKQLRAAMQQGMLEVISCDVDWNSRIDFFGQVPKSWNQMLKVKQALDPHQLMAPNRFFESTVS